MKTTRLATSRAKPISWVTTTIVIPSEASSRITSSTSLTSSGSSALVTSSKSITLRVHRQRPGDRDALLLAAREPVGVLVDLLARARPGEQRLRLPARLLATAAEHLLLGDADVLERGHVREEVELLEDHADPPADEVEPRRQADAR